MNWKSGGIFVLGSSITLFGLRGLISDSGEAITNPNNKEESHKGPSSWTEISVESKLGQKAEIESTWQPAPVNADVATEPYNFGVTKEQEAKNRAEADQIYKALNDYAFKMFLPCGNGTGWILDYEIPKNPDEYPTKWYIATNLHVIFDLRFSEDTYKQNTPFWGPYVQNLRTKNQEKIKALNADKGRLKNKCSDSYNFGYLDINLGQQDTGAQLGANVGAISKGQMKEPKLFYAALDFLDREVKEKYKLSNHFADFGVVEFEFTSPEEARKATNGFATKYKDGHPINLLADPLEKKYKTRQDWVNSKDNYYILAYPNGPSDEFAYTKNWDEKTSISSHFGGFASAERTSVWGKWTIKFKWGGVEYKEFGHRYSFSHNVLSAGASGGLYVDGAGNAVGVIIQGSSSINWAQPLRSAGTTEAIQGVDTPAYDLISGANGQRFSYKSQVEKYILNEGRETWLSKKAGWKKAS